MTSLTAEHAQMKAQLAALVVQLQQSDARLAQQAQEHAATVEQLKQAHEAEKAALNTRWKVPVDALNGTARKLQEESKAKDEVIKTLRLGNRNQNLMLFRVRVGASAADVLDQLAAVVDCTAGDLEVVLLPPKAGAPTRPVKLCCLKPGVRQALLKVQAKLRKATGLILDVDLTPAQQAERNAQWAQTKEVHDAGGYWFWQGPSLRVRLDDRTSVSAAAWLKEKNAPQGGTAGGKPGGKKGGAQA
ncbi:MAG: hypothetical protein ACKO45_13270 [Cyanobium sp.]